MTIHTTWPTSATLTGAAELNAVHLKFKQDDVGFKLQTLISAVNRLQSAVSIIQLALGSAAASMAGTSLFSAFSAFSGTAALTGVSTMAGLSNFRASNPA